MNSNRLRKIDWEYLVNRRESLLFSSITERSYFGDRFQKNTGLKQKINAILRLSSGDIFYSASELEGVGRLMEKGGVTTLKKFRQRLVRAVNAFGQFAHKIEKTDCEKLSDSQIQHLTKKYFQLALKAHNFLMPMPVADRVLTKIIQKSLPSAPDSINQSWLTTLTLPKKENEYSQEEKSFLKIALACQQKQCNLEKLIKIHLKKFAVIGARWYWWNNAWKKEDIEDRIKEFFAQKKNPRQELLNRKKMSKDKRAAVKEISEKLKIKNNSKLGRLISLAKEFAYLRTWRTDILYGAGYHARNLFYQIADRAKIDKDLLPYLTCQEMVCLAERQKLPFDQKELRARKNGFVVVFFNDEYKVFTDKKIIKKIDSIIEKPSQKNEIAGQIAFSGKVRGRVKLVLTNADIKKVQRGDILVAVMTFPHFVPAMEKAAAFVTDEGGILCHAAIVAREMRKPCIIGTKIATRVLKDGDLVKVDAEKGIVRKIT